jgi:hypothetical protein
MEYIYYGLISSSASIYSLRDLGERVRYQNTVSDTLSQDVMLS